MPKDKEPISIPSEESPEWQEYLATATTARTKPRDAAWRKRKNMLFPDGRIRKTLDHTPDQFVGRLRELEDGMDPFHSVRRNPIMDDWHYITQPTISIGTPVDGWRDERDKELWILYTSKRFEDDPSFEELVKLGRRLAVAGRLRANKDE